MIIGNEEKMNFLKDLLEKIEQGTILISGPEGIGKFSFLKNYLQQKNWEKIILETEDKFFKIESARTLISLSNKKTEKRIIVINDAHKFSQEAQNTLLKTLEESLSKTIFVLISHRFSKILPTIRSRSVLIKFNAISKEKTYEVLKNKGYSDEEIEKALNFYPYQPGKAIKLLENKNKLFLFEKFILAKNEEKILLLEELKNSFSLSEFLEYYLIFERKNFKNKKILKNLIDLYSDSDYYLNFDIQLANLILNYG